MGSGYNKLKTFDFTDVLLQKGKKKGKMDYTLAKLYKPKNGKNWYVYYSFRCPETGVMKLFKEKRGINRIASLKERKIEGEKIVFAINEWLKEGNSPFNDPEEKEYAGLNLLQMLQEIFKIQQASLRKRSWEKYKDAIRVLTEFLNKRNMLTIDANRFTPVLASSFSDFLMVDKKYSGRTHNNHIRNCTTLFNLLIDKEIVVKNPFQKVDKKEEEVGKNIAFPDHVRDKIKEHIAGKNLPIEWGMMLQYYCFIRPEELTKLQRKHLDFSLWKIHVRSSNSKSKRQEGVEIPEQFREDLKEKYETLDDEDYLFSKGLVPGFKPILRNRLSEAHKIIIDELKLSKEYTFYSWKHTGVVAAYKAGMNIYALMRQLRHTSLEYTQIYLKSLGLLDNTEFSTKQPKF